MWYMKRLRFLASKYKLPIIIIILALYGIFLGGTHFIAWDDIVENSMLKAGLIEYPFKSPQYYFQLKLNSLYYFIDRVLLSLGFSLQTIAIFNSMLLGALSMIALGLSSYIIHRSFLAIPVAIIIEKFRLIDFGANYDISLIDTRTPQGQLGLSACSIVLSLFFCTKHVGRFFLIGLAPVFHITLGIWLNGAIALAYIILIYFKNIKISKSEIKSYSIGLTFSVLFTVLTFDFNSPEGFLFDKQHFIAYLKNWDLHQVPFQINQWNLWLALFLPIAGIFYYRKDQLKLLFTTLLTLSLIGFFQGHFGQYLVNFMPAYWWSTLATRLLNYTLFLAPGVLITFAIAKTRVVSKAILTLFLLFLFDSALADWSFIYMLDRYAIYKNIVLIFLYGLCISLLLPRFKDLPIYTNKLFISIISIFAIFVFTLYATTSKKAYSFNVSQMKYYENDEFYRKVNKQGTFLLSTPSCEQCQLITGLPNIMDLDTIDDLVYNSNMMSFYRDVMLDLYGIEFLRPEIPYRNSINLIEKKIFKEWSQRDRQQWVMLKDKYKVDLILVPRSWNLNLELIDENDIHRAYRIN